MGLSTAYHCSYAASHARGAEVQFSGFAAYPRVLEVSSAEVVGEAVQAQVGTKPNFACPVPEADEVLAMVVQKQDRMLQAVGRRAPRLLWWTGETKVSLTQAKSLGLALGQRV